MQSATQGIDVGTVVLGQLPLLVQQPGQRLSILGALIGRQAPLNRRDLFGGHQAA